MKIYKNKKTKKQKRQKKWCVKLGKYDGHISLEAVDSKTGGFVANLITFFDDGEISMNYNAFLAMNESGYDPSEHGNRFDSMGRLVIDNQGDK